MSYSASLDPESKSRRQRYRDHSVNASGLPIFSKGWWLDAVAGDDHWDAAIVERDGAVIASMPFVQRRKFGLTWLTQPPLTQNLGPWMRETKANYAKRLGQEKELLSELVDQLPRFDHFRQNWHHAIVNWSPLYWRGFQQTTRYTYLLPDLSNLEKIWAGMRDNIRDDIRKAENHFNIEVSTDHDIEDFIALNTLTFDRQGKKPPYSPECIRRLDRACATNNARQIFIAKDEQGRHHAGAYIIWDEQSAHYLMGGGDPDLRSSGASSLCLWKAIQFAGARTKSSDFEGSMIESVERFFRGFGAIQTPYFSISKTPSRLLRLRQSLIELGR